MSAIVLVSFFCIESVSDILSNYGYNTNVSYCVGVLFLH